MIVTRDNKGMDILPIQSQDPFRVIRGRQAPHVRPYILYAQLNDLNGSVMSNEHIHALNEPLTRMLEGRISSTVTHEVGATVSRVFVFS